MGEPRSPKQQREQLVGSLRAQGKSWVEVAEALRHRYHFNARMALRYAHGWSQRQAADEWNRRWPDESKTFKSFSSWEQWPSRTGHAPSFDNFGKLAELYACAVSDLLSDLPDFRHRDTATGAQETTLALPKPDAALVVPSDVAVWTTAIGLPLPDNFVTVLMQHLGSLASADRDVLSTPRDRDRAYHQLVQFLRSWAHTMDRRDMLGVLNLAAITASLFSTVDGGEYERVTSVLTKPSRVDEQTIGHIEAVLWHCERQDVALGPRAALSTVLVQRDLARALAHEAENPGLGALVLCEMSHLATWRGTPRIGIDHAVAAEQWANRTDDLRVRAYTADVAARAYAADGQRDACLTTLDTAHAVLTTADDQAPNCNTYDEAAHISIRGECHLKLRAADHAVSYAQQSFETLDRSRARTVAMTIIDLSEAYVQCNEIDEAA